MNITQKYYILEIDRNQVIIGDELQNIFSFRLNNGEAYNERYYYPELNRIPVFDFCEGIGRYVLSPSRGEIYHQMLKISMEQYKQMFKPKYKRNLPSWW